jgi:3-oxoacyl-[acyl-carrier-protein] synthase-3
MKSRYWCAPGETTLTLARAAVQRALAAQPALREQIDVVLVASGTTVPVLHPGDLEHPGIGDISPFLVRDLGRPGVLGLDVKACYCTGFIRCLELADALLANPNHRAALLVATEQGSRLATAATNRSAFCFIMSDAAGAAVVRKRTGVSPGEPPSGLIDYMNAHDAEKVDWIAVGPDGRSMLMKGTRAGAETRARLVQSARILLDRNGLRPQDVAWLLPIQTHAGLLEEVRAELGWPVEKMIWRGGVTGFSGSASIPACLAEQIERGTIKKGELVLSIAVGAGLSYGAALFHA